MVISIIIPIYKNKKHLEKCFGSIFNSSAFRKNYEVIAIDNVSGDGISDFIKKNYPQVILIENFENKGASFARNQGIRSAKGDFIMLLDVDAYLKEGFFLKLTKILKSLPNEVGAVSAKIINHGSKRIFSCGLKISDIYRVHDIGKGKDANEFDKSFFVDGPNSCCAIFKREVLDDIKEIDYFDNDFFFLFEDADLALRFKNKGYKCLFVPDLVCYHYGKSSPFNEEYRRFLSFRNRWFMVLKHNKGLRLFRFLLISFIYDFVRTVHFALTNRYFVLALKQIIKYGRSRHL